MQTLNLENAVILDTETTGLDSDARICEISIIDALSGDVLYSNLVSPLRSIPDDAQKIHGITDADVQSSPSFDYVWNEIKSILFGKKVIAYNFDFDYRMVAQSLSDFDYPLQNLSYFLLHDGTNCAMTWYAEFFGQIHDSRTSYRWQSLTNACKQQGVDVSDLRAHTALADCEMTRRLIHAVNAKIEAR
ncbi:3'-5' exonuclease [Vibrio anguillarum]|uniref:3'-5' exonuclease n=5 Tax=Vibrio anguillarum TaxID=55601 RepID=A0AAW4BHJ3_VIBAN|nr:3'-5' exonuclease [Vibrio anguillarum]MBF4311643.1 3'-5' exonuclease [Vibrio anguillarum]MBF4326867.1 3'-5' exonuclease [Vibrio anguillarum]MBF4378719.1 3'-5' exonuclease [Vibrio anguillarum]MBF4437231.1 3'-5' exonuclease [Vibrio anguillarum]MBF4444766.1 3'-5' exonuclease [Vibrio anguillarum]